MGLKVGGGRNGLASQVWGDSNENWVIMLNPVSGGVRPPARTMTAHREGKSKGKGGEKIWFENITLNGERERGF